MACALLASVNENYMQFGWNSTVKLQHDFIKTRVAFLRGYSDLSVTRLGNSTRETARKKAEGSDKKRPGGEGQSGEGTNERGCVTQNRNK